CRCGLLGAPPTALFRSDVRSPPYTSRFTFASAAIASSEPRSSVLLTLPPSTYFAVQGMPSFSIGQRPNGSEKFTGSPLANPYRFIPPANPIGSSCENRPGRG